jgi:hypothetical protein
MYECNAVVDNVVDGDDIYVNKVLLTEGYAKEYFGGTKVN